MKALTADVPKVTSNPLMAGGGSEVTAGSTSASSGVAGIDRSKLILIGSLTCGGAVLLTILAIVLFLGLRRRPQGR